MEPGAKGSFDNPSFDSDVNDQLDDNMLVNSKDDGGNETIPVIPTSSSTPSEIPPRLLKEIKMKTRQRENSLRTGSRLVLERASRV